MHGHHLKEFVNTVKRFILQTDLEVQQFSFLKEHYKRFSPASLKPNTAFLFSTQYMRLFVSSYFDNMAQSEFTMFLYFY